MSARVLALVVDCYGSQGGIARYNQDLFEGLVEGGGAEILVLPRLGDTAGLTLPVGIRQARATYGRLGFVLAALRAAWRERPLDIVFCGHVFMAPLALWLARLTGARCWVQAHGTDVWTGRRPAVRRAIEAADMVTSVSRYTRQSLLGWIDLAPERVRVLPDTVRDMFRPGASSCDVRKRYDLGQGPLLLTVGRLAASERYKGHEQIFAVLPALRARFPDLVHVVVGDGDDRRWLEARAAELAGDPRTVRFLGYVPDGDLPDLYRQADLYVMPSSQEGFGIVYLESAACGLRVLGGLGGGSGDAIPNEAIGLRVDPADREALIGAIVRLLGEGRVDPSAIDPYRRPRFAVAAQRLLARLMAYPRRMSNES